MRRSAVAAVAICSGAILSSVGVPSALDAQSGANQGKGFDAGKLYSFGSVDDISMHQGSITWTIPIGPSFSVDGGLSYALKLVGTSSVWDYESVVLPDPPPPPQEPPTAIEARPQRFANSGFAWRLSLGELFDWTEEKNRTALGEDGVGRFLYVDAEFGERVFYPTLHAGDSDGAPDESRTEYTRDGSYLRLRNLNPATNLVFELDLPDGSIKVFARASTSSPFFLTEVRDRFGNALEIVYEDDPPDEQYSSQWELFDGWRTHYVRFKIEAGQEIVKQIDLAGFETRSVYNLVHSPTSIRRSCKHESWYPGAPPDTVFVPLLTQVVLPSGETYAMEQYNVTETCGGPGAVADRPGTLARMRLPSRGVLEWTYAERNSQNTGSGYPPGIHGNSFAGVATRKLLTQAGACEDGTEGGNCTWEYRYCSHSSATGPGCPDPPVTSNVFERQVVVKSPLGDHAVYFFSTPPNRFANGQGSDPDWTGWDYGLPFARSIADPSGGGRFLSAEIYDGAISPANKRRSTYVAYERDQIPGSLGGPEAPADQWYNTNRRLVSSRTVFHDDGGSSITTANSSWDGISNFRTTTVSESGAFEGSTRVTTTNFNPASGSNPGTGTYAVNLVDNSVAPGFTMFPAGKPWIIDSYDQVTATEGSSQLVTQVCFDRDGAGDTGYATTGAILRSRQFADAISPALAGGSDVIVAHSRDGAGNVTDEQWFGGDGASLGTIDPLCSMNLPSADYRMAHTYSNGVRATSKYLNPNGTALNPSFFVLDRTIDASGLVEEERDTAGLATRFEYDSSYRMTRLYADGGAGGADNGATWHYAHTNASGSNLAKVAMRACEPGVTTCTDANALQASEVRYDGHGRVERERRLLPAGYSKRVYATSAMGYRLKASELQADALGDGGLEYTLWKGFDPFGRPATITPPDGTSHDVTFSHTGSRLMSRTVKVATSITGSETSATTTETYDLHGRLRRVEEPAGSADAITSATYGYDAAGRLTSVAHFANVPGTGNVTQNRTFVFDGRGFLTEETMPEKVGRVCYLGYDARGHATRREDSTTASCSPTMSSGPRDVRFTFDAAERLRTVTEGGSDGRILKELFYDADPLTPIEATGASLGKLVHTVNHNHLIGLDILARQTNFYFGIEGRLSNRDTETWQAPASTLNRFIEQGWTYDRLGQVISIDYPNELAGGFFDTLGSQPRTQTFGYTRGFLTSVPGAASSLTYHDNATLHQVIHSNGVTETIARDPDWMARPASISTSGVDGGANWSSGSYAYDGSGNVEAIGNDRFRYDKVSRLLESRMRLVPGLAGTEHTQTFSFDGFGNLLGMVGVGGTTLDTTASSNRLTAGGATFDDAGNLTAWNGNSYTYDRLNRMSERVTAGANVRQWKFLYTADDERLWSSDTAVAFREQRVMLRDLDGRPLREYAYEPPAVQGSLTGGDAPLAVCPGSPPNALFCDGFESGNTSGWLPPTDDRYRDWIYRGAQLLAADGSHEDRNHFHLDHLGTPRQITGVVPPGALAAQHAYLPFGAELPGSTSNHERLRFTGHERDLSNFSNPADDLDYMHARSSSPITGRFLSIDPIRGEQSVPQSWNRYAYVKGNPLSLIDPTGMKDKRSTSDKAMLEDKEVLAAVDEILVESNLTADFANRQEAGAVVAATGAGDFSIDGGVVSQGHINKVDFNLIKTDTGLKTAYGNDLAATIHSHPGTGKAEVGGERVIVVGGRASDADKSLAAITGKPAFILDSRQSMIRVDPSSGRSQKVLTGKDYRAYLARARAARVNSENNK